jgi:hypothetical protein
VFQIGYVLKSRCRYRKQAQEIVNLNKRQAAVYGISACLTNMLYYFLVSLLSFFASDFL